jgi:hypothetical protein
LKIEELTGEASIRKGTKEIMVQIIGEEREAVAPGRMKSSSRKKSKKKAA